MMVPNGISAATDNLGRKQGNSLDALPSTTPNMANVLDLKLRCPAIKWYRLTQL